MILFQDGVEVDRFVGARSKEEMVGRINSFLGGDSAAAA